MTLPIWPGIIVFASAFGTAAAQKGLTVGQAMGMSVFMFAGASQMVVIEVWQDTWSLATILGATAITAIVNSRSILMGAAVQPWIRGAPQWQNAVTLGLLTDANWLIGMRYHGQGGAIAASCSGRDSRSGLCGPPQRCRATSLGRWSANRSA